MSGPDFQGLHVLVLESRRSRELAALVSTYGGPSLCRPRPARDSARVEFRRDGVRRRPDRRRVRSRRPAHGRRHARTPGGRRPRRSPGRVRGGPRPRTKVAVRGPKPLAVLRELQVQPWVTAPEPNTWRELLAALDAHTDHTRLQGFRVAVQEYGDGEPGPVAGPRSTRRERDAGARLPVGAAGRPRAAARRRAGRWRAVSSMSPSSRPPRKWSTCCRWRPRWTSRMQSARGCRSSLSRRLVRPRARNCGSRV